MTDSSHISVWSSECNPCSARETAQNKNHFTSFYPVFVWKASEQHVSLLKEKSNDVLLCLPTMSLTDLGKQEAH